MTELQGKLEELERERDALDHECNELHSKHGDALNQIELFKEQLASKPSEPAAATGDENLAAGESIAPNNREFEQLQVKAYRFENAHKIALEEIKQLQKQIGELKKELRDSQDELKSQQKELVYFQKMLGDGVDAATLTQQFNAKYYKGKKGIALKDVERLIEMNPAMVSPLTSAQLPDLLEIRDQVLLKHPATEKLYQHALQVSNALIEAIEKSTGDYSHLQRVLAEVDRQKLYCQAALRERDELQGKYDAAKKRLGLLGDRGW